VVTNDRERSICGRFSANCIGSNYLTNITFVQYKTAMTYKLIVLNLVIILNAAYYVMDH